MQSSRRESLDWFEISSRALVYEIILQFLVGIFLAFQYKSGSNGYESVVQIRSTWIGTFTSGLHYWGSLILIVHSLGQLTFALWTAQYQNFRLRWWGTVILFVGALSAQISGNILPMDRHGVQTGVIETGLMGSIPFVGKFIKSIAIGGQTMDYGVGTVWFHYHEILVSFILLVGCFLVVKPKANAKERSAQYLAFIPIAILIFVAILERPPLGNRALPVDFSQFDAFVSWYTWPMHGMLKVFENISPTLGWIGFAVVPGIFVLFLLLVPMLHKKLKKVGIQLIFAIFAVGFVGSGFLYGGPIASLVGNRDPAPNIAATLPTRKITPPNKATLALMREGQAQFNSIGCSGCHGQDGANGSSGPNLTRLWMIHDSEWFQKYIHNPRSVDSSSTMPSFSGLTKTQLSELGAFLSHPHTKS